MKITKKDIENAALAVIKEVIKDKKYENLTKGVIENTDESYTTEQVKRIVEEVNKKVFTMAFENLEDKNFSFEVANIDEVLKSKKYKPTTTSYVRKKTTHEKGCKSTGSGERKNHPASRTGNCTGRKYQQFRSS